MLKRGIANQTLFYIALAVLILGAIGYYLQFYTDINFSPTSEEGSGDLPAPLRPYLCPSINYEHVQEIGRFARYVGERCYPSEHSVEYCRNTVCIDPATGSPYEPTASQIEIAKQNALEACERRVDWFYANAVCRGPCLNPPGITPDPRRSCSVVYSGHLNAAVPFVFRPTSDPEELYYRCWVEAAAIGLYNLNVYCNAL